MTDNYPKTFKVKIPHHPDCVSGDIDLWDVLYEGIDGNLLLRCGTCKTVLFFDKKIEQLRYATKDEYAEYIIKKLQ